MQLRAFEIRDRMTCIPAIAVRMTQWVENLIEEPDQVQWLMRRGGFQTLDSSGPNAVILIRLDDQKAHADWCDWGDRTMSRAHMHIETNWDRLKSGDVIDVRFLFGETKQPCKSDRVFETTRVVSP